MQYEEITKKSNQQLAKEAIRRIEMIMLADPKHIFSLWEVMGKGDLEKRLIPWARHRLNFLRAGGIFDRGVLKVKRKKGKSIYDDKLEMTDKDIISYLKKHSGLL